LPALNENPDNAAVHARLLTSTNNQYLAEPCNAPSRSTVDWFCCGKIVWMAKDPHHTCQVANFTYVDRFNGLISKMTYYVSSGS